MTLDNLPIIRKSNDLIDARYKLSIAEQRLILLLLSEISPSDKDFKDYEIRAADLAEMFNLELDGYLYEQLQNAATSLVGQRIILREHKTVEVMAWFSYIRYEEGAGVVKLRFDKSLKPYLLQLKSHFTQYHLNHAVDFKSQYSIRLYELLKMDAFKAKNGQFERVFEIKELRLIFGIEKKEYSLFADFKRWVIAPAMVDVSNKTDLNIIDAKYGKTGRKITSVTFVVKIRPVPPTQSLE
jgi:plasmid replication initiation protein